MVAKNKENGKDENTTGRNEKKKNEIVKIEHRVEIEADDMISAVKSRRLLAIQAKKEREQQERQMRGKTNKGEWGISVLGVGCKAK